MIIVNAPAAFAMVWKALKPLMNPSTLEKIEVFGAGRGAGHQQRLLELVAPEDLPHFLGGTCTCGGAPGGCLARDVGPWSDEGIERALQETPFWDVLARFMPESDGSGTQRT